MTIKSKMTRIQEIEYLKNILEEGSGSDIIVKEYHKSGKTYIYIYHSRKFAFDMIHLH